MRIFSLERPKTSNLCTPKDPTARCRFDHSAGLMTFSRLKVQSVPKGSQSVAFTFAYAHYPDRNWMHRAFSR